MGGLCALEPPPSARLCCKWRGEAGECRKRVILGGDLEELGNEDCLRLHVPPADVVSLPFSDHRQRLVASQCSLGGSQAAEAQPGPDQPFDPPVILLNDVVQVFALPQPREAPQVTSPLHVGHCTWAEMAKVSSAKPMECHRREAAFLSTVIVRGLTVCGWASALRKKRLADTASRRADSRKSMVWPRLSTARYS